MKKCLPNLCTLLNLITGGIGIFFSLTGPTNLAIYCVWIGAIFDILDGTLARLLHACSSFGKQLDSFADLTTFGWLPAFLIARLISDIATPSSHSDWKLWLPCTALFIPICASIRLARFNLRNPQQTWFVGLPVPAQGLFLSTLPLIVAKNHYPWLTAWLTKPHYLVALVVTSALLMVTQLKLIAFKFETYAWYPNRFRYSFLLITAGIILLLRLEGIALSIVCYVASAACSHFVKEQP